jgi:hypothetical protein
MVKNNGGRGNKNLLVLQLMYILSVFYDLLIRIHTVRQKTMQDSFNDIRIAEFWFHLANAVRLPPPPQVAHKHALCTAVSSSRCHRNLTL